LASLSVEKKKEKEKERKESPAAQTPSLSLSRASFPLLPPAWATLGPPLFSLSLSLRSPAARSPSLLSPSPRGPRTAAQPFPSAPPPERPLLPSSSARPVPPVRRFFPLAPYSIFPLAGPAALPLTVGRSAAPLGSLPRARKVPLASTEPSLPSRNPPALGLGRTATARGMRGTRCRATRTPRLPAFPPFLVAAVPHVLSQPPPRPSRSSLSRTALLRRSVPDKP
jgi:hypothetical protein